MHHTSDIGFFGAERRAHGQSAPGYQMLLGGHVGQTAVAGETILADFKLGDGGIAIGVDATRRLGCKA